MRAYEEIVTETTDNEKNLKNRLHEIITKYNEQRNYAKFSLTKKTISLTNKIARVQKKLFSEEDACSDYEVATKITHKEKALKLLLDTFLLYNKKQKDCIKYILAQQLSNTEKVERLQELFK